MCKVDKVGTMIKRTVCAGVLIRLDKIQTFLFIMQIEFFMLFVPKAFTR